MFAQLAYLGMGEREIKGKQYISQHALHLSLNQGDLNGAAQCASGFGPWGAVSAECCRHGKDTQHLPIGCSSPAGASHSLTHQPRWIYPHRSKTPQASQSADSDLRGNKTAV